MLVPTLWLTSALALCSSAFARSSTGDRVLVVVEPQVERSSYSKFWNSLTARGFELTFKEPKDESAELLKYGETAYDHLILFAPTAKSFSGALSPKNILAAQFAGVNTLYLLSSDISELQRDTLREYDLEFAERDQLYLDAFSYANGSSPSTPVLTAAHSLVSNGPLLSASTLTGGPIVYPSGAAHSAGANPFLIDVLHGSKTGYVGAEKALSADEAAVEDSLTKGSKQGVVGGKNANLVSALQTRNNVRVGFVGSGATFSDEWWGKTVKTSDGQSIETGNAGFAQDFTQWVFQETGVVKVISTHHYRKGESQPRELYTKKDDITFSIEVSQHVTTSNGSSSWTSVSLPDLQLDFTMLDPHVRTALVEDSTSSTPHSTNYKARFIAPDRHGVFKFVVEYWRPGWSYLTHSQRASIVPLRHDQHPRFITGAWPFYTSAVSMSAAFLLFCALWVALGEGEKKGKKKSE